MSCSIDIDVDEYCELLEKANPRARKPHKCIECCRTIKVGEKYLYEKIVDNGISVIKTCSDCETLRSFLCSWHYGEVRYDIEENIGELDISSEQLDGLTDEAREYILGLIE